MAYKLRERQNSKQNEIDELKPENIEAMSMDDIRTFVTFCQSRAEANDILIMAERMKRLQQEMIESENTRFYQRKYNKLKRDYQEYMKKVNFIDISDIELETEKYITKKRETEAIDKEMTNFICKDNQIEYESDHYVSDQVEEFEFSDRETSVDEDMDLDCESNMNEDMDENNEEFTEDESIDIDNNNNNTNNNEDIITFSINEGITTEIDELRWENEKLKEEIEDYKNTISLLLLTVPQHEVIKKPPKKKRRKMKRKRKTKQKKESMDVITDEVPTLDNLKETFSKLEKSNTNTPSNNNIPNITSTTTNNYENKDVQPISNATTKKQQVSYFLFSVF